MGNDGEEDEGDGIRGLDFAKIDVECMVGGRKPEEALKCVRGPEGVQVVGKLDALWERVPGRGSQLKIFRR